MSDLDAILSGETIEATETVTETVTETETEAVEAKGEAETESKEEVKATDGETPAPKEESKSDWQYQAYKDEKSKRQEVEKKLKEFEDASKAVPVQAPDVFKDQDAYTDHLANQTMAAVGNVKTELSQFHAEREFGQDVVSQKLVTFTQMMEADPGLGNRVNNSPSPYYEMMDIVDKAERLKQFDNVDAMEEKMRVEIEAKVRKEIAEEGGQKQSTSSTPSLNSQRSAEGGNNSAGELTLGEILGR